MGKIFETDFRFLVKERTTGKVQYLVFNNFSEVLMTKCSFWEEE